MLSLHARSPSEPQSRSAAVEGGKFSQSADGGGPPTVAGFKSCSGQFLRNGRLGRRPHSFRCAAIVVRSSLPAKFTPDGTSGWS
jgi:hypothetical protein